MTGERFFSCKYCRQCSRAALLDFGEVFTAMCYKSGSGSGKVASFESPALVYNLSTPAKS